MTEHSFSVLVKSVLITINTRMKLAPNPLQVPVDIILILSLIWWRPGGDRSTTLTGLVIKLDYGGRQLNVRKQNH